MYRNDNLDMGQSDKFMTIKCVNIGNIEELKKHGGKVNESLEKT